MDITDPRIAPTDKRLHWSDAMRAFVDDRGAIYETEQQIEARGPKPRPPAFEHRPIDGYVQIGPTSYERIGPGPDFRDVWQAQFHPARPAQADRETRAIATAAAVLIGEGRGAEGVALELLAATRRR